MQVRPAVEADLAAMSRILIASITELCGPDHGNDAAVIAAWTANKTAPGIRQMMDSAELYVAERDGCIVAVGALAGDAITLNYVDPQCRGTGVSSALLDALEAILVARGVTMAHVKSTQTARAFYLARGWVEDAPVTRGRFISAHPMHKVLASREP